MLLTKKYAAIQQDRILKIVSSVDAKRLNIPVRTGNDPTKIANTDELITQVVPIKFGDASQLKNDLAPLLSPDADFASNASSNALVITDTSANVRRLVQIVSALDTSMASSVDVKVFQLKFANATNAAKLINDVFSNLDAARTSGSTDPNAGGNNSGRGSRGGNPGGGGDPGGGGPGGWGRFFQQPAAQGKSTGKVTAGADERTNSVVVTGPTESLTVVASVIKELDSNPAAEETVFVYRLRNAQSANMESVLNSLFNGTATTNRNTTSNADTIRNARASSSSSSSTGTGGRTGNTSTSGFGSSSNTGSSRFGNNTTNNNTSGAGRVSSNASQTAAELEGQVSIIADIDSNSLLVRTSPANYPRVRSILDELDKPVKQVLIKVLLAEVTHEGGTDIGAELSALNLRSGVGADGTTPLGQIGGGNFNIPVTGANATGLVVQLLETNFNATIRALETAGKLDVLSRPYILASDNQLASITVGQEVPFITNSRVTDTGQTLNTIEYRDIGILLDVIPHINPDGLVILDVAPEISTLTSTTVPISEQVNAPVIAKRSAQSRVGVRNGETIVIGGLMEDRVTESVSKVPLLGDIPLFGELFKRTIKNKTKTELLIFLTPHVALDPDQVPLMSQDEVKGTKILPNAVAPGMYDEHQGGLKRGATLPATRPADGASSDLTPAAELNSEKNTAQ